jgi:hypothetical protein
VFFPTDLLKGAVDSAKKCRILHVKTLKGKAKVCEELEFSTKKEQLRELDRKYARMLSGWHILNFLRFLTQFFLTERFGF